MGLWRSPHPMARWRSCRRSFLAVAILTNLLSNAATAILFSPVALEAAHQLNVEDPLPFILAVIYGANCCFATPIAYQTNMLVMGPGHYKFRDFLLFGGRIGVAVMGGVYNCCPLAVRFVSA
jgi:di/tricarboxylate transporter